MKYTGFMHLYSYFLIWYIEILYDFKKTLEIVKFNIANRCHPSYSFLLGF